MATSPVVEDKESVIILAAGSSSRLGQPKQMVEINGLPLLLRSVQAALGAGFTHVVVVLGFNAEAHKHAIHHLPVDVVINMDWQKGMGNSLKAGVQHVVNLKQETRFVIVMVCDQARLSALHLRTLRETHIKTSKPIVASHYDHMTGVPALFHQSLFPELLNIKDLQGAKVVIANNEHLVESIDWPDGSIDIDTPEDLDKIKSL